MNERLEQARHLGQRIDAGWQREDVEAQLTRLHARQRRRVRLVVALPLAAGAAVAGIVVAVLGRHEAAPPPVRAVSERVVAPVVAPAVTPRPQSPEMPEPPEAPALAPGALALGDGSVVTPLGKNSRLVARQVSDTDVVVAITGGGAAFDVPDREARRFHAVLGGLELETHGAAFRVQIARRQIEVTAERGEVSARWNRERRVVATGETRAFAIAPRDEAAQVMRDEPRTAAQPPTWREDASRGDYAAAWAGLAGSQEPINGMADLLLAGDVARLSGHAAAAVERLSRAAAVHPDDPRAPLAAFTLGRVHLEDLGAPRDAALAFGRARMLAPDGPLAEDALAREVEAWSRAGETEKARSLAVMYTQRYPEGRRVHAVRQFGGLERP